MIGNPGPAGPNGTMGVEVRNNVLLLIVNITGSLINRALLGLQDQLVTMVLKEERDLLDHL